MVLPAFLLPFPYGPGGGSDQTGKAQAGVIQQFSVYGVFSGGALADQAEYVMHGRLFPFYRAFYGVFLRSIALKHFFEVMSEIADRGYGRNRIRFSIIVL